MMEQLVLLFPTYFLWYLHLTATSYDTF